MPFRYTLDTREEPAKLMAIHCYTGTWSQSNYREHESLLLAAVGKAGLRPVNAPVDPRYNSPFSLWFLRRNEVMVEVEAPP